jgi:hypothetical protein
MMHRLERRRELRVDERRRRDVALDDALGHLVGLPAEQAAAEAHLVQHDAQREDVGPQVELVAEDLLRGHVRQLARELPVRARLQARPRRRDPEVDDLHRPVVADVDVGRVDVAVTQPERPTLIVDPRVHVVQPLERLHDDAERQLHRQHLPVLTARRSTATSSSPFRSSMAMKYSPCSSPRS